jgi:hypothetical protein
LENITSGPVGKPLGGAKPGIRVAIVRANQIEHRDYELSESPGPAGRLRRPKKLWLDEM